MTDQLIEISKKEDEVTVQFGIDGKKYLLSWRMICFRCRNQWSRVLRSCILSIVFTSSSYQQV